MAKQKTKAQREVDQKAALTRRVLDVAMGAEGGEVSPREDEFMASAAFLSRFIPALTSAFGFDEYYGAACNIDEYDNVESTVEFLFRNGVRA